MNCIDYASTISPKNAKDKLMKIVSLSQSSLKETLILEKLFCYFRIFFLIANLVLSFQKQLKNLIIN